MTQSSSCTLKTFWVLLTYRTSAHRLCCKSLSCPWWKCSVHKSSKSPGKFSFSSAISICDVIDTMKNIHMNPLAQRKLYLGKGVLSTGTMSLLGRWSKLLSLLVWRWPLSWALYNSIVMMLPAKLICHVSICCVSVCAKLSQFSSDSHVKKQKPNKMGFQEHFKHIH